jgi:hypothetical protein
VILDAASPCIACSEADGEWLNRIFGPKTRFYDGSNMHSGDPLQDGQVELKDDIVTNTPLLPRPPKNEDPYLVSLNNYTIPIAPTVLSLSIYVFTIVR